MTAMFRSLGIFNYRLWFAGALISNIGVWMQRTAQDWIVLTELTDHDATALGINMGLQFLPQLLLVAWAGLIADRFDRRKLLIITQAVMAALGLALGLIVVTGIAELWHVYAFSFLLGVVAAIDTPARQAFVSDLVSEKNLPNAVALNSASFNTARLIGPAVAGGLTVLVGAGWVMLLNGVTYGATIIALLLLDKSALRKPKRAPRGRGQLLEGFRYVRHRPDLMVIMVIVFLLGTFGLNFPIYSSTMASIEFGLGAGEYGVLSSILAIGSVTGALLAARRDRPRLRLVFASAGLFGASLVVAALMPTYWTYAASLVLVGFTSITLMTTANGTVQTTTSPVMRGRVMALYMAIFVGGTPLGAPIVGWVADELGPRWALGVGATAGFVAMGVGVLWMVASRRMRIRYDSSLRSRFYLSYEGDGREIAEEDLALDESVARKG
ncbi:MULTISPECIES: MFS transporter [unclassified Salinibacterium]|uniref:MFS transporter n=1 Tax=unclassified Salinibacterium TaxID=2632331 RepID=UPI00142281F2|nr:MULTISPECIES: MFS transporter [unclassified Salinibacterium]